MQEQPPLSTASLSDGEIVHLVASSRDNVDRGTYIIAETGTLNFGHVTKIAPDAVVKHKFFIEPQELVSARLVRRYTSIPVPMHERVFQGRLDGRRKSFLVQQFISGCVLLDAWPQLGWWARFRVFVTLRFYIRELRSISSRAGPPPFPGPPSDDGVPQKCTGMLFTKDGSGPFRSYREMSRWYQNRLLVLQQLFKQDVNSEPFDDGAPLVFTHKDLHPRNIILGDDGQLWVIDWAEAGWYPSWFEAASMTAFARNSRSIPPSWSSWIPFIAGPCDNPGQGPFLRAISYSLVVLLADIENLVSRVPQKRTTN